MNDIVMTILTVIIFWSGYILGFMTGGIYRSKRKKELEKRFNRSVQNVIAQENEYIGGYNEKLS